MRFDIIKKIKNAFPYFSLIFFLFLIHNFYSNNTSDFLFLSNFRFTNILIIITLSFFYLVTEAVVLKKIAKYFGKDLNLLTSFFVINTTYLFNTFVQFSGLGFRAYFLKKIYNIKISNFLIFSLFVVLIEFFTFSSIGSIFLIFSDIFSYNIEISKFSKFIIYFINILSLFIFLFHEKIYFFTIKFFNLKDFKIIKKISFFYKQSKKKKLKIFLLNFIFIFFIQSFLLFLIFVVCASIFRSHNLISLSIIASIATDFSFIFALTPYAIGISETFVYFISSGMGVTLAQVLFLSNVFRLGTLCIYVIIGPIYFYFFAKKL
jgi:uncharacterized membrane protein YbhN (UPF0104 family)